MKVVSRLLSRSLRQSAPLARWSRLRLLDMEPLEPRRLLSISLTPIPNATFAQGSTAQTVDLNTTFTDNATSANDLTFTAKSDNTAIVQPTVDQGLLTLNIAPADSGIAHITVLATAPDNSAASDIFRIQVTASANRMISIPIGPSRPEFRYVMANNTVGTIALSGPGTGTIVMGGDNLDLLGDHVRGANQEIESITLNGTTAATTLTINGTTKSRGTVFPDVGNITINGSIGKIHTGRDILDGDVTITGGVRTLFLTYASNSNFTINQSIGRIKFTEGVFTDENFSTPAPVNLQALNWISNDSVPDTFGAAYMVNLFASQNFDVGLQLTGDGAPHFQILHFKVLGVIGGTWSVPGISAAMRIGGTTGDFNGTFGFLPDILDFGSFGGILDIPSLQKMTVNGNMVDATLDFTGTGVTDLNNLQVHGRIAGTAILAAGNIGEIRSQTLEESIVFAGVSTPLPSGQDLPTSASNLAATASIGVIQLRPSGKLTGFLGSDIAAANIGALGLGTTKVNNNGVTFGVAAENLNFINVRDLTNHRIILFRNVNNAATLAQQISAQGLNLQDMTITVLS